MASRKNKLLTMVQLRRQVREATLLSRPLPAYAYLDDEVKEARSKIGILRHPPIGMLEAQRDLLANHNQERREKKEWSRRAQLKKAQEEADKAVADRVNAWRSSVPSMAQGTQYGGTMAEKPSKDNDGESMKAEKRAAPQKHRTEKGSMEDRLFSDDEDGEALGSEDGF